MRTPSSPAGQEGRVPVGARRPRRTTAAGPLVIAALAAATLAALAAGCASAGPTAAPAAQSPGPAAASSPTTSPARAAGHAHRRSWPAVIPVPQPPARLHQTRALPSARTAVFRAEMTDLWAAVVTGRPSLGMPAFFPLSAYQQVKAIPDPTSDWHDRLVFDYRLDVRAAHDLLGRSARRDRLVRVIVPESQAAWIDPGVCYNGVGYWHAAGARILYRQHGTLRSIGIASLISWRGRWYVVHFGAVLRSADVGIVDQPARGPGVTGPAGGC